MEDPATAPADRPIRCEYEQTTLALRTLSLLTTAQRFPGLNPWIARQGATLTPDLRHTHQIVFGPLRGALLYGGPYGGPAWPFETYRDGPGGTADEAAIVMRDGALENLRARLRRAVSPTAGQLVPTAERLLAERDTFVAALEHLARTEPFAEPLDTELLHEAHALLHEPGRLYDTVLDHLSDLSSRRLPGGIMGGFGHEWERIERMMAWQAQMFARALRLLPPAMPLGEVFRALTGRDLPPETTALPEVAEALAGKREVVLVPCWHLGRWVLPWDAGDGQLRLCFSEPPNADVSLLRESAVSRGELRARLAALADESRLRILELVRARDEMSAQELIAALRLSQSNVSRHLNLLVQMGYLYERRTAAATKTYRVSAYYLDRTAGALRRLAAGEPFEPETPEADVSRELRRFVDRDGRLTSWPPAHERDKVLILEYLAAGFKPARVYTEPELAGVLNQRSAVSDHAALRRALCEYRFMDRARDGSRYWLTGTLPDHDVPRE